MTWRLAGTTSGQRGAGLAAFRMAGQAGAVLAGLGAGWAAAALAGPHAGPGPGPVAALVGGLAVLLAAANGYSKAYSP